KSASSREFSPIFDAPRISTFPKNGTQFATEQNIAGEMFFGRA
ncbi:unnamed protein product, partial [Ixodes pacificus]